MSYVSTFRNLVLQKPILVIFDVTRLCNERCRMCNIWKTKSEDMNLLQIEEKAGILRKSGVGYVFLQGGEPTVRSDLPQVVDVFLKYGIKPTVITNGILFKDTLAQELAARKCNVAISLDTLNPETFTKIRGVNQFETVKTNIEEGSRITKRRGNWAITTTITELATLEEIKSLESFAAQYGYMYAIRPYVHTIGTAGKSDDELAYKDINRIIEIFQYMRGRAKENNYLAYLMYGEHIKYIQGEKQARCDALRRSLVMSPTGLFSPCIEFTGEAEELDTLFSKQKAWFERCNNCNRLTPCYYNDAREIGVIWRNKLRIMGAFPRILSQMARYGNFF